MEDKVWIVMIKDDVTGVIYQGSLEADSEIEARSRIMLTSERMFMGSQRIHYDQVPEGLTMPISMLRQMLDDFDSAGGLYSVGGEDE